MEETYYFDHLFQMNRKTTVSALENMNNEIEQLIRQIKSKNLSPIEEIMMVYDYTKQLESAEKDTSLHVRQLDGVLNSKRAVCAGFSNVLNEILIRMGYKAATLECYIENVGHMYSIVEVKDPKYNINGIYNFDAALDSLNKNNFSNEQREDSYAFFARTVDEFKHLKKERISRGCSIAITKGNSDRYQEIVQELPLRTMNIINGFFPSEENYAYLKNIYQKGNDKNTWESFNQPYLFQLFQLGFKARDTESIPLETLEQIIRNVKKAKNDSLTNEELEARIEQIRQINHLLFQQHYNDSRLRFQVKPKNYVEKSQYETYQNKMHELLYRKQEDEQIVSTFVFLNNQENQITHSIRKIKGKDTETLLEGVFDADYHFGTQFLMPELNYYLDLCDFPVGKINPPEYLNYHVRDYGMQSDNSFVLSIQAADLQLLQSLDTKVRKKNVLQQEMQSQINHLQDSKK